MEKRRSWKILGKKLNSNSLPLVNAQAGLGCLVFADDGLLDLVVSDCDVAVKADGQRVETIRVVVFIRKDFFAGLRVACRANVEAPTDPSEIDEERVTSKMHSRADATTETKWKIEVDKTGISCVQETVRVELLRVREHFGVTHYTAIQRRR